MTKSDNPSQQVVNVLIVSDQLEQIDLTQKALKSEMLLSTHNALSIPDIKNILDFEKIDLILVGYSETVIGVGGIRNAVRELKLHTPILQLLPRTDPQPVANFIKNGADIVCDATDTVDILSSANVLINSHKNKSENKKYLASIKDYRNKFQDLYQGLADPICYITDGVFVDCNPAFLRAFEIVEKSELEELTILNFVERKSLAEFKQHIRKSARQDMSASPVVFKMLSKLDKALEMIVMSKPAKFDDEDVVQLYLRSTKEGGMPSGAALFDEGTGLANKEQMNFFLQQKIKLFTSSDEQGILAYIMINNYREIWGTDGFFEAEKFIKAVAIFIKKSMPSHTETSRYTDDGILAYIPNLAQEKANDVLTKLVIDLDTVTPTGMKRMIEPKCYAGISVIDKNSNHHELISQLFRAARGNALLGGSVRVSEPTASEILQKDKKRVDTLKNIIAESRFTMLFQPIVNFEPEGISRYNERIVLLDEDNQAHDNSMMFNLAERYHLTHQIDKWKVTSILQKLLAIDVSERKNLKIYINISTDSLINEGFTSWLVEQMVQTGLGGENIIFEIMIDSVQEAYSGAISFCQAVRNSKARIAISNIGTLTTDDLRIIDDIKPNVLKLDIREIDSLDEREEAEFMEEIKEKATALKATIIAEYLESPGQLSHVWPYDIKLIQGNGMTPVIEEMDFDFNDFQI